MSKYSLSFFFPLHNLNKILRLCVALLRVIRDDPPLPLTLLLESAYRRLVGRLIFQFVLFLVEGVGVCACARACVCEGWGWGRLPSAISI